MPYFFNINFHDSIQGTEFNLDVGEQDHFEVFFIGKLAIIVAYYDITPEISWTMTYDIVDTENGNTWSITEDDISIDYSIINYSEPDLLFQNDEGDLLLTLYSEGQDDTYEIIVVELLNDERRIRILEDEDELENYVNISEDIHCSYSFSNGIIHVEFEEIPSLSLPPSNNNTNIIEG